MKVAEEKAKKKAGQKRKRQVAGKEEGSSESQRMRPVEDSALLEQAGVNIPSDEDFAAVMRVYQCAVKIDKVVEDNPEVELLKKMLKKAEAINTDIEADLIDLQDKLDYLNGVLILDLIEENSLFQGVISSLANVGDEIAAAEALLEVGSLEAEEVPLVAEELEMARKLEAEARSEVASLRQRVQQLESKLQGEEEKIIKARSEGFLHAWELALALEQDVDLELLCLENAVVGKKIIRPMVNGEPEVLFDSSEEAE